MSARPRHVAFFEAYGHLNAGAQRILQLLAAGLPDHGYTSEVIATRDGPFAAAARELGVAVTIVPTRPALDHYGKSTTGRRVPSAIAALPAYWRVLARHLRGRSGIVHTCSQRGVVLAGPAARLAGAKFVWHVAVVEENRALSVACDAITHRTIGLASTLRSPSLRPWRRQGVIFPPLHARFEDVPPPVPGETPLVVTAGRLEPMKQFELLFDAMVLVRQKVPEVRLRILGGVQEGHESYAEQLHERRDRLGLQDVVEFAGWVDRPEHHWRTAWLHVQPSKFEGNSLAVMEAMATGVPVVVCAAVGNATVVVDGVSGYCVPPDDAAALAEAMVRVLVDRDLAAQMGTEARSVARRLYAVDRVVAQAAELYDDLLR